MKVLIPAAGLGTRLRPHTHHRPKPLVHVAGSTVLGHVLDKLEDLDIDEVVFVIGHLGDQIESYVRERYDFPVQFVTQSELKGQAHAIALAREYLGGPLLILFVDTIFETDLSGLAEGTEDGVIYVSEVDDPRRFGIVMLDSDGHIREFVEKPAIPTSNLAIAGLYYVADSSWLLRAIDDLIAQGKLTKGEYYLADALQLMIEGGARFVTRPLSVWEDCGTREALLRTNRYLLGRMVSDVETRLGADVAVIPPVRIGRDVRVRASVIGPYVTVGDGCDIDGCIVGPYVSLDQGVRAYSALLADTIVDRDADLGRVALEHSLVGVAGRVRGQRGRVNIGDSSEVDLSAPATEGTS